MHNFQCTAVSKTERKLRQFQPDKGKIKKRWNTQWNAADRELMIVRDLSARLSQTSVSASISDRSWSQTSRFCGPSKPKHTDTDTQTDWQRNFRVLSFLLQSSFLDYWADSTRAVTRRGVLGVWTPAKIWQEWLRRWLLQGWKRT